MPIFRFANNNIKIGFVALLLLIGGPTFGETKRPKNTLFVGTVFPWYAYDKLIMTQPKAGMSVNIGYLKSIYFQYDFLEFGLSLMHRSIAFNSYYFAPGYSIMANGNLDYQHSIGMEELYVPVSFCHLIQTKGAKRSQWFYGGGLSARIMLNTSSSIVSLKDGIQVYDGYTPMSVQYPLIYDHLGVDLNLKFGLLRPQNQSIHALYGELIYTYPFSNIYYSGSGLSNSIYIFDGFVNLCVGYKF